MDEGILSPSPAQPVQSLDGRIRFTSGRDRNLDIYPMADAGDWAPRPDFASSERTVRYGTTNRAELRAACDELTRRPTTFSSPFTLGAQRALQVTVSPAESVRESSA